MRRRPIAWPLGAVFMTAALSGCDKETLDTWFPREGRQPADSSASLFSPEPLEEAKATLRTDLPQPIEALSLLVYPDRLLLQARDPDEPTRVNEYTYRAGRLSGPERVELLGDGRLEHNLFSFDTADLSKIPALVEAAREEMRTPDSEVSRVLLKRNLPESMDIQFRVFINSPRRDAHLDATKDGTLID